MAGSGGLRKWGVVVIGSLEFFFVFFFFESYAEDSVLKVLKNLQFYLKNVPTDTQPPLNQHLPQPFNLFHSFIAGFSFVFVQTTPACDYNFENSFITSNETRVASQNQFTFNAGRHASFSAIAFQSLPVR